jgi:hypothetical protein
MIDWTIPAVKPATRAYTGLLIKAEEEPTTMAPETGAFTMSRIITPPFIKDDMQNAPRTEADIPSNSEEGPL